ncbi:MAG: type I methionyl aminopeptidase [Planctomycetota bacterium]|nr:MAG: type I methionyl aminopeptidase [Planctomycetota bacterium]
MFGDQLSSTPTLPGPNDPCWCGSGKKYKKCHQPKDRLALLQGRPAGPQGDAAVEKVNPRAVRPGVVSPMRSVPDHIVRPDYAATGRPMGKRPKTLIKTPDQIERMRAAGKAARRVLASALAAVKPGVTTDEVDAIAHAAFIREGGYPSTLNYHGYPKSICTSVNEVICHGIPDSRPLEKGDIVNVDVTIYLNGMHGDCSETVIVGETDAQSQQLVDTTRQCLMAAIATVRPGSRLNEIGRAIEKVASVHNYGVVRAFVGHGIGEVFHMDPQVPHYYDRNASLVLQPGMTFTIEPMINMGQARHETWNDGWTAVTADGKRSAQFEHTLLVTPQGVEILTLDEHLQQPFPH